MDPGAGARSSSPQREAAELAAGPVRESSCLSLALVTLFKGFDGVLEGRGAESSPLACRCWFGVCNGKSCVAFDSLSSLVHTRIYSAWHPFETDVVSYVQLP